MTAQQRCCLKFLFVFLFFSPTCFTSCGFITYQYLAFSCAKGKIMAVESEFYFLNYILRNDFWTVHVSLKN